MADQKISAVTNLTEADLATGDEFPIVDASAAQTKAITVGELDLRWALWDMTIALGDESTAISATATAVVTWRMPRAVTLTEVRLSVNSATTTGTLTGDINEGGSSILSTKLTIDATEKSSETAATPAVISDSALADDAEMSFDWDGIGDGTATGGKLVLIGRVAV